MKILVICSGHCDFVDVLEKLPVTVTCRSFEESVYEDTSVYDAYCVFAEGGILDGRIREKLEHEADCGKHVFTSAIESFRYMYSDNPVNTVKKRLVCVQDGENGIPGLEIGDLLDDMSNYTRNTYVITGEMTPLLVYRDFVIAHVHTDMPKEEILSGCSWGLWKYGESVMMASFAIQNFNKARFAPRENWQKLIKYIVHWLTGFTPEWMPEPVVRHEDEFDTDDEAVFEKFRERAVDKGIRWTEQFLVDNGAGGIYDGLAHDISPRGVQNHMKRVRADCIGECAAMYRIYADLTGKEKYREYSDRMYEFNYGPMLEKNGLFRGMLRWTTSAWGVCYQDDAARATVFDFIISALTGDRSHIESLDMILSYLSGITPKDGLLPARVDCCGHNEQTLKALAESEHGHAAAHYNAYYSAVLLLGYQLTGKEQYLEIGVKGLETLMSKYPDLRREQSETEEMCRLMLPLAVLYHTTGLEKHLEMLCRVTEDLEKHIHPTGGVQEWDTGYTAACSRESRGECSVLTENGDPVADLLYSTNWLAAGLAYAYYATGDEKFKNLWKRTVGFCIRAQVISKDPLIDGGWARVFDMDRCEIVGCPHDAGWASCSMSTGWTASHIVTGMMLPDFIEKHGGLKKLR